jgi:hypothetical protein
MTVYFPKDRTPLIFMPLYLYANGPETFLAGIDGRVVGKSTPATVQEKTIRPCLYGKLNTFLHFAFDLPAVPYWA